MNCSVKEIQYVFLSSLWLLLGVFVKDFQSQDVAKTAKDHLQTFIAVWVLSILKCFSTPGALERLKNFP